MSLCSRRRNPLSATASPRCFDLCCVNAQHLAFRLCGTFLGAGELRTNRPSELGKRATAGVRAAGFASGFDLLVRSHVRLRCLRVQLGSGNLPLVPLGESLVHRPTVQHLPSPQGRMPSIPQPKRFDLDAPTVASSWRGARNGWIRRAPYAAEKRARVHDRQLPHCP